MKIGIVVLILTIVGGVAMFFTNNNNDTQASSQNWSNVSSDIASGSMLLDVRTVEEYADGHVASSTLFPLADIQAGKLPSVDKTKPIYVYCRSGNRSAQATAVLKNSGFTNVVDLGGMTDVLRLGATEEKRS